MLQYILLGLIAAPVLATQPDAPSSAIAHTNMVPGTADAGTVAIGETAFRVGFVLADDNAKSFSIKAAVAGDFTFSTNKADYLVGHIDAGATSCPADLSGATIKAHAASSNSSITTGSLTFDVAATASEITVTTDAQAIKGGQCVVVIISKATHKNCTGAIVVTPSGAADFGSLKANTLNATYKGTCVPCADAILTTAPDTATVIAKKGYCFCGNSTSTDASEKMCGAKDATDTCAVVYKTAGQLSAGDTFKCGSDSSGGGKNPESGSASFTIAASTLVVSLLMRHFF